MSEYMSPGTKVHYWGGDDGDLRTGDEGVVIETFDGHLGELWAIVDWDRGLTQAVETADLGEL